MHAQAKLDVKLICAYSVEVESVTEYIVLSLHCGLKVHIYIEG